MVAYSTVVNLYHPHGILLARIQIFDTQCFAVQPWKILMASVIVWSDETVKSVVILARQPGFNLIILGVPPVGKRGQDFIDLGVSHLYGFMIPNLDSMGHP